MLCSGETSGTSQQRVRTRLAKRGGEPCTKRESGDEADASKAKNIGCERAQKEERARGSMGDRFVASRR